MSIFRAAQRLGVTGFNPSALSVSKHGLRVATIWAASLAFTNVAGCATTGPFNPDSLSAAEIGRVGQICRSVVGLQPMETHYDACVQSLSDTVKERDELTDAEQARNACLAQGDRPGSTKLDVCEASQTAADPPGQPAGAADPAPLDANPPVKSYFMVSRATAFRRERVACAELGFEPATRAFEKCATGLEAAILGANNPL